MAIFIHCSEVLGKIRMLANSMEVLSNTNDVIIVSYSARRGGGYVGLFS